MSALAKQWMEEIEVEQEEDAALDGPMDTAKASRYLYVIGTLEQEIQKVRDDAQVLLDQIQLWELAEVRKLEARISWLAQGLENFARVSGKKTVKLPTGNLCLRAVQPRLDVDEEAFFRANPPAELVRVIPEQRKPDRVAIRGWIKETGEIPEGVVWEEFDRPAFSYTTLGGKSDGE